MLLLLTTTFYAQTKGISYQAVIFNPSTKILPGVSPGTVPFTNKKICLRFTFIDAVGSSEYQETITVTTDDFGIVNTIIGLGNQTGGYATSFGAISWNTNEKILLTELDVTATCSNFEEISKQTLATAPFALHAITADTITGIAAIANGGTGASTVTGAKLNLGLSNVDNTSDLDKPISIAAQAALNVKANVADVAASLALKENTANKSTITTLGTSDILFPTQNAVKTYVDTNISTLSNTGNALQASVEANATATTAAIAALQAHVDANEVAANTAIALKEDAANKTINLSTDGSSDIKFPSAKAVKNYVDSATTALTTLTIGSVPFSNGSTLTQDNDNLFWDSTNKRLGIGMKTPASPLHIFGTGANPAGRTWLTVQNNQISSAAGARFINGNGSVAAFQFSGSTYPLGQNFIVATSSDHPVTFMTKGDSPSGGSAPITFSPGGYENEMARFTATKRFGLNTKNPTSTFHAVGAVGQIYITRFESQTANNWNQFVSTSGTGEYGIWNDRFYFQNLSTSGGIGFYGSNSNRLDLGIAQNGFVGVGTNASSELLQIGSDNEIATNRKAMIFGTGGYASPNGFGINSNGDKIIFYKGSDYDGRFGISSGGEVWLKSISTQGGAVGSLSSYTGNSVSPLGLRMNIGPSGGFGLGGTITSYSNYSGASIVGLSNGNIGIGTTSPIGKLHIQAPSSYSPATNRHITISEPSGSATHISQSSDGALRILNNAVNYMGTSGGELWIKPGTGEFNGFNRSMTFSTNSTAHNIMFSPNGIERIRVVSSNGNVGIGTSAPQNQLHIAGSTNTTYQQITSGVGLQSNSSGSGLITALNNTPADPSDTVISNGANFGFNGSANNFFGIGLGATRYGGHDVWFQTGAQNGGGYRWYTGGATERMTLSKGGKLGIGTINPLRSLHVVGDTPVLSTIPNVYNGAIIENGDNVSLFLVTGVARECAISFGDSLNPKGSIVYSNTTDALAITVNDQERIKIRNDGNVGIGTSSPTSKLQVVGLPIHADNTAALASGLTVGAFYHNGDGIVRVVF